LISTGLFLLVKDESFNGFHELGKVLVSTDFSESIFGSQDSGNAPAMPHVASSPAFDSSGDLTDSTEQRLDRIRAAEEASEVSGESQSNDGQCFLRPSSRLLAASRLMGLSHSTVSSTRRRASS
jgi:hypothetical protein